MARRYKAIRVLAGTFKGRPLKYPDDRSVRPTMQRTRAVVFDSVGPQVRGAVFVDLFAGAGSMGIEALSRGAAFVHFVEHDRAALGCLRHNLDACEIPSARYRVHALDARQFGSWAAGRGIRPAVVYADPPYDDDTSPLSLEFLSGIDYPAHGVVMVEHPDRVTLEHTAAFVRGRVKKIGQTHVSFFTPAGRMDS